LGVPYKKVFNDAIQAVQVFFHDPVGNAIELNQENNTANLFSLAQNKLEETKVKLESEIDSQPSQQESQSESQHDQTTDSPLESQPQTEPNQPGIEPTENEPEILSMAEPEIQMNPIATVIAEENLESGIVLQLPDTTEESIMQSAVTEKPDNIQSVESHSNETQTNVVETSAFEVATTPFVTAQAAELQVEQIKPEPLINKVSYKCESKDQGSTDQNKKMRNLGPENVEKS